LKKFSFKEAKISELEVREASSLISREEIFARRGLDKGSCLSNDEIAGVGRTPSTFPN